MTNTRNTYTGRLTVFREYPTSESLSANVVLSDGNSFRYWKCPRGFIEAVSGNNATSNLAVSFTANNNGPNPRSVKVLQEQ